MLYFFAGCRNGKEIINKNRGGNPMKLMKSDITIAIFFYFLLALQGTAFGEETKASPPSNKQSSPAVVPYQKPDSSKGIQPATKPSSRTTKKFTHLGFFNLEAHGVEKKVANLVSDVILSELGIIPDCIVIGSKEIDTMMGFEEKRQLAGCTDNSCMIAIGGALGVDKLILGSVGKLGNTYMINLKLLNINTAKLEKMFQKRLAGGKEEDFLDIIPDALATLFPENAKLWGRTAPESVTSSYVEEKKNPWPWVVVGVGGASLITGGVLTVLSAQKYSEWKNTKETDPRYNSLKNEIRNYDTGSYVCYGVGAAAVAGGLVWYFLTRDEKVSTVKKAVNLDISPSIGIVSGLVLNGSW